MFNYDWLCHLHQRYPLQCHTVLCTERACNEMKVMLCSMAPIYIIYIYMRLLCTFVCDISILKFAAHISTNPTNRAILNNIQCICVVFVFVIYASYNMHHISNVWPLINWMRGRVPPACSVKRKTNSKNCKE